MEFTDKDLENAIRSLVDGGRTIKVCGIKDCEAIRLMGGWISSTYDHSLLDGYENIVYSVCPWHVQKITEAQKSACVAGLGRIAGFYEAFLGGLEKYEASNRFMKKLGQPGLEESLIKLEEMLLAGLSNNLLFSVIEDISASGTDYILPGGSRAGSCFARQDIEDVDIKDLLLSVALTYLSITEPALGGKVFEARERLHARVRELGLMQKPR